MGGATNIRRFLERFGPAGADLAVAGLYDRREQQFFRRALESLGHQLSDGSAALAELGFFMCDRDLEDEMIRAIGLATTASDAPARPGGPSVGSGGSRTLISSPSR